MLYEINFTMPTLKIKDIEDYKTRVEEILFWQVKDTLAMKTVAFKGIADIRSLGDFFLILAMILFSLITLPFAIAYLVICFLELLLYTIFLPLYLIPIVRILPTIVCTAVWSLSVAVGFFGGVALERL